MIFQLHLGVHLWQYTKKGDAFIALKAKRLANKYINTRLVSLDAKMLSQYSTQ